MVRLLEILLLLVVFPGPLLASAVASLSSLEGEVTILRSGVLIPSEKVADGFALEPFDTVSTGATGKAIVGFPASIGVSGTLRLDTGTSLYLDLTPLKKEQTLGVELLAGGVSIQVAAVLGSSMVEVRTEAGSFSGQGPSFRVVVSPAGDVLVASTAGRVVCQFPKRTVFSEPGSIVQVLPLEQIVQTLPVNVSTLNAFEETWAAQRKQALRDSVAIAFRTMASRYQLQASYFQRAWDRVQNETKEDEKGLLAATADLRRSAFPLERSLFRIKVLRGLFDEGTLAPSVELSRGYFAKEFFRQEAVDEPVWASRLGVARGFYKSLADRWGGAFPRVADGVVLTWDSDFFH